MPSYRMLAWQRDCLILDFSEPYREQAEADICMANVHCFFVVVFILLYHPLTLREGILTSVKKQEFRYVKWQD